MKRFVLTGSADRDIGQLTHFLVQEAGPVIARKVLREIRNAMELLGRQPGAGHSRKEIDYHPGAEPVQILRVLHGMRDIEEILSRQ